MDLKEGGDAKCSNCVQIHVMHRKQSFPKEKFELSRMCTTQSRVLQCPWNMCRLVPPPLLCRLLFTIYPWQTEIQKHHEYDIFSVLSVPMCKTRPTKIRMPVSQLYTKLRRRNDVSIKPVQLVQNVHRFASCAKGQVMLHSSALCKWGTNEKGMVTSIDLVLFASLCTMDLETTCATMRENCDQSHTLSTNNWVSMNH